MATTPTTGSNIRDLLGREAAAAATGRANLLGEGRPIAIDLLDPNPFQHRTRLDEDKLEELVESIAAHGQLEAVPVRPHPTEPGRFQLIAGHRRTEAFRRLRDRAADDAARAQWSQINATIKQGTTDRQMRIWGVVENADRDDTSPVEQGAALVALQEQEQLTLEQLIDETKMEPNRVKRLVRLARAPEVIRAGCTKGIMVPLTAEDGTPLTTPSGRAKQEHRHLDLFAALEFAALHAALLRDGLSQKKANERVERLITQALTDGWSFRRIQERCKEARAPRAGRASTRGPETGGGEGTPSTPDAPERPLFKADERQLVIYRTRIADAAPSQRAALRATLEKLIAEALS